MTASPRIDRRTQVERRQIRARRLHAAGASQRSIAAELGVSKQTVRDYIRGLPTPAPRATPLPRQETPCSTHPNPDLWFALESGTLDADTRKKQTKEAVAICGGCPVRAECLQYSLDADISCGVFGGLTAAERSRLKKGAA